MSETSAARRIQRKVGCRYMTALNAYRNWMHEYKGSEPIGDYRRRGEEVIVKRLKENNNGVA